VVNRVPASFRPSFPAPEPIAGMGTFPEIAAGILHWESVRERAIGMGQHSMGRMADDLAEAHRSAWARFAAEGDCRCPVTGDKIAREPSPALQQRTPQSPTELGSKEEPFIQSTSPPGGVDRGSHRSWDTGRRSSFILPSLEGRSSEPTSLRLHRVVRGVGRGFVGYSLRLVAEM
jgi:hypothetical protein